MKNILYISSNDPNYFNGGAIGTKKFIECFQKLEAEKKINIYYFMSGEGKAKFEIKKKIKKRTKLKALISRVCGLSDQLGLYYFQIVNEIKKNKIDIVVIQSSRLGNLSKIIKKKCPNVKILQNFDNFEYKFSDMYTKQMNKFIRNIELKNIKKIEYQAIKNSDFSIFLTKKDCNEIEKFYQVKIKGTIIPLIYPRAKLKKINTELNTAIFTGSLDMQSNIEAVEFLIDNIDEILKKTSIKKIIVAGRKPSLKLVKNIEKINAIELYKNIPSELMTEILEKSSIYISPVFTGSGMKTKFLEAISHGIPIVASDHTLEGYDWFDISEYPFIQKFRDNSLEEMLVGINTISSVENSRESILKFYSSNFDKDIILNKLEDILLEKLK